MSCRPVRCRDLAGGTNQSSVTRKIRRNRWLCRTPSRARRRAFRAGCGRGRSSPPAVARAKAD